MRRWSEFEKISPTCCRGVSWFQHLRGDIARAGSPHCNLASRLPCNRVQISDNCSGRFRKQIVQIIQKFRPKINLNIEVFHNHVIDIMVFVYFALSDLSSKASNWQTCKLHCPSNIFLFYFVRPCICVLKLSATINAILILPSF